MFRLIIDDRRSPILPFNDDIIIRDGESAIALIELLSDLNPVSYLFDSVYLDHDLGNGATGAMVAKVIAGLFPRLGRKYYTISANPDGVESILRWLPNATQMTITEVGRLFRSA